MASSQFNHNKKRNPGLVYEFLVRRMAAQLLDSDKEGYERSLAIVREHFGPGSPLARELEIFETVRSTRGVTEAVARDVVTEIRRHARRLDARSLDARKGVLIRDLNRAFGKSFYSDHRVPDYRLLASIQMLVDGYRRDGTLGDSVTRIRLEEALVGYMTGSPSKNDARGDGEVDGLVCALAAKKFQERYGHVLSAEQKRLLERYMRSSMSGDSTGLVSHLESERDRICAILMDERRAEEIRTDSVMAGRMDEAISRLASMRLGEPDDEAVQEMMLYQRLCEEIGSHE